jgi:hypothetical protein
VLHRRHYVLAVEVLAGTLYIHRIAHRGVWVWDWNRASGCRSSLGDVSRTCGALRCHEDISRELWVEGRGHPGGGRDCTPELRRGHAI